MDMGIGIRRSIEVPRSELNLLSEDTAQSRPRRFPSLKRERDFRGCHCAR
jgi:hypothetical protein